MIEGISSLIEREKIPPQISLNLWLSMQSKHLARL